MSQRLPILPAPGLITDDTDFSDANRFVGCDKARFYMGKPQPIGGWSKYFASQLTGLCRNLLPWDDLNGYENIAFGTHTNLYVYLNGVLYDITPAGLAAGAADGAGAPGYGAGGYGAGGYGGSSTTEYFPRTWSLGNWGQNLVASPRLQGLYIWSNDTSAIAVAIAQAPANMLAMLVTPERQILALGCTQVNGTFNPLAIRGCKVEDYTNWTPSDASTAFEYVLEPGGGGRVVAGRMVGPYVVVWTDHGVHLGQYTGNTANLYRFDLVATNCGLVGPNAVKVFNGTAYWITPDYQFYSYTPGTPPQLIGCPISKDFKDHVADGQWDKIAGTSVGQFGEIWWFYPDSRDGSECSRYIAMNITVPYGQPFQWSKGTLARSACVDAGPTRYPIFVSIDGYVYAHENGQTDNGGVLSGSYTIALPYLEEGGRFAIVQGIEPDFKDQSGGLSLSFLTRKYAQDTARSKGPYTLEPGRTSKNFQFSGRSAEMTVAWSSSPAFHRAGKPVLLVDPTGAE